jgi:uncharacterized membrane protein (UPF0182 family)
VRRVSISIAFFVLVVLVAPLALSLWLDARWFAAQQLEAVFLLRLRTQVELGIGGGLFAAALAFANLTWATRRLRQIALKEEQDLLVPTILVATVIPVSVIAGAFLGVAAAGEWQALLGFQAQVPFGIPDPSFGQDVAFYVWSLPWLLAVRNWLAATLLIVTIASAAVYVLGLSMIRSPDSDYLEAPLSNLSMHPLTTSMTRHLSLLGAGLLALLSATYWLNNWELVYSQRGVVYGASATDVHVDYPANAFMGCLTLAAAAALLVLAIRANGPPSARLLRTASAALLVWIGLAFLLGVVLPGLYEQLAVHPQQFAAELPYIQNNIGATRRAMDLERIDVRDLAGAGALDASVLARNQAALSDIRITDWRPLQDAYNQLQRIRQYYTFRDIAVDRYNLSAGRQQVMLSARELDPNSLAQIAHTWQNFHLVYTHGQGAVVSPVSRVDDQGLPVLLESDIPSTSDEPVLQIDVPQVYFGLEPVDYVIVGTRLNEFDRPGESLSAEMTSRYAGSGGVAVGDGLERLATAAALGDMNLLLSKDVSADSQVLLHRQIQERIEHAAPFLRLDDDPYQVVLDGRLMWVQDAYTWTDRYPDATQYGSANYLRNSIKITVDDYDGSMHFYVVQPDEPILQVWMRLYPSLFTPLGAAPEGLPAHFRYPEDLFNAQASLLATYHMTDPQTFYNREDLWSVAQETYAGKLQPMQAYFTTLRLPGEVGTEFATILPFTPSGQNRTNMLAWMVARSDAPNYGELRVYRFPQGKLVFGPQQIEARINQEPGISSEITLWSQQGSQVLRGNLLVIPLEDAVLYVQPLYIQAQSNPLPELKRVIVASTSAVVMSDRLDTALTALGQGRSGEILSSNQFQSSPSNTTTGAITSAANLAAAARDHLRAAEAAAGRGDWSTYGAEMTALGQLLDQFAAAGGS